MLVSLLLFMFHTQVTCDWVEISQQHYLKPARTTRVYPQIPAIINVEKTTKTNRGYVNNSLPNPNWSKGAIYKIPSSEMKRLKDSGTIRSTPINLEDKPTSEVSKKSSERVYYNKDNVRRITFTNTEDFLKPLEVLNLSDLDYDEEEFPTIEVDDGTFSVEQFEHSKHVTVVVPTIDEEDYTSDNLPNSVKSENKIHDKKTLFTVPKKDLTFESPPTVGQNTSKMFQNGSNGHSNSVNVSDTDDLYKVQTLKEKSSSTSHSTKSEKIKQEDTKYLNKNFSSSDTTFEEISNEKNSENSKKKDNNILNQIQMLDSSSDTSSYKLTQGKPRLEKNVLRIDELPKRSKIRNPEEVMLEEILHESKENFHKTNISTVKTVTIKSTITKVNPKISESEGKDSRSKPFESQIERTKDKHIGAIDSREKEIRDIKNKKESVSTAPPSSKIEESKKIETVQYNAPTQLPVKTEHLFEPGGSNSHKEGRPDFITIVENNHNDEQEKQQLFGLTAANNQEETIIKVKPPSTETTATVKNEFTTKLSRIEPIATEPGKKVESDKSESIKPLKVKKVDQERETEETLTNDTTADTLGTLGKVLKLVTETISRNTRKSLRGKMRYLEELRDTILASIEQRLEAVFPDDDAVPRRPRSAHAQERGHVEFPSSESALMTISFLTFAVFLIKLVLQVIHAYKHKAMVPAVVATVGRAYQQYSKIKSDEVK